MHELNGFQESWGFSTTYPSQKKVHKCFVSASGGYWSFQWLFHKQFFNLRHSCTSPVLCWSLGSISIAIAWEKKVLGCHKFCSVDSVDRLTFHRPKPHLSCQKCPKTVFSSERRCPNVHSVKKWKHSYQNFLRYGRKRAETVTSYWSPLKRV